MDLTTIKQKMDSNTYKSFEEAASDFELMLNNCVTFNPNSPYEEIAKSLKKKFEALRDGFRRRGEQQSGKVRMDIYIYIQFCMCESCVKLIV